MKISNREIFFPINGPFLLLKTFTKLFKKSIYVVRKFSQKLLRDQYNICSSMDSIAVWLISE